MRNKYGFTFGADPEEFLFDDAGVPQPAVGIIPGTKNAPVSVPGGAVQRDGLAAEFNIKPSSSFDEFFGRVDIVRRKLRSFLPKGWELRPVPAVEFTADQLAAVPPDALELGCDPDYNAWTGEVNPPPEPIKGKQGLRTGAGHLHIGWTAGADIDNPEHRKHCFDLVKQLDWCVGAWLIRLEAESEMSAEAVLRRNLYGRAGACRIKDYGVEYRVPSNIWLTFNKPGKTQLWLRMQYAIEQMRRHYMPDKGLKDNPALITGINSGVIPELLAKRYHFPIMAIKG